ncbi:MAG: hypothetical protein IK131_09635 [Paludibacteraceae bacterium]|nr:hypothetical protein [Paludibacteraceae bacterium]
MREKYYTHLTISPIVTDVSTSFFISTQNEDMTGIYYYPLNFIAQDYMFEGNSLSFKKMGGKSPVVSLSDDGTVSAGALSLNGGSENLGIKFDNGSSRWNLSVKNENSYATMSMDVHELVVNGDVSLPTSDFYSKNVRAGSVVSGNIRSEGYMEATTNIYLRSREYDGSSYIPNLRLSGLHDEGTSGIEATTRFLMSTQNTTPGGDKRVYPLNFVARNYGFEGSSISLTKWGGETPAIVLTDTGYVSAKGLSLNAGSTTGSTLTLSPKEDDSWSLNATKGTGEDAAPAALDVNVSDLNVKGKLVCESGFTASGPVSFDNGITANNVSSIIGVSTGGGYLLYSEMAKYSPQLSILAKKDAGGKAYFSISSRYVIPSGTYYSPLNIEADTIDFVGSSFSFRKLDATEPAIVLSDTGVVAAKGLFLSAKSASEPGLKISSSADGSWELSAIKPGETPAPASLNMNVSALNVNGPIVCKDQMKVASVETGVLRANDVTVNLNNAADYVFDENYDLKSLEEVESFVKENKHLPGVPSASQLEEKGMSVSEMSNLLLEKVEELTLHLIRVEKENRALKAEVEKLNEMLKK